MLNVGDNMQKKDRQKLQNIIDMLRGNINRMCVTNDKEELEEMRYYAKRKIDMIADINKKRLEE